jgi:hypothetical protein
MISLRLCIGNISQSKADEGVSIAGPFGNSLLVWEQNFFANILL